MTTSLRGPGAIVVVAALGVTLAACGGGSSSPSSGSTDPSASSTPGPQGLPANFSSVSGKVTAVASKHAAVKVHTSSGTTTVAFGSVTRFTRRSASSRAALAKGDCVTVAGGNGSATASVTATSVTVTSTSGCPSGGVRRFGGPSGQAPFGGGSSTGPFIQRFGQRPGTGPSASPFPRPSGSPGFRGGPGTIRASMGTVQSVSASSFVIKPPVGSTPVTVHTTSSTTYSTATNVTATDVATGDCVAAVGTKSNSVVDAFSVTISQPSNGSCPRQPAIGPGFGFRQVPPDGTGSGDSNA